MRTHPSSEERHALEVNRIMISIQQGAWCSKHDWNQSYFSYAWFIIRLQNSNMDSEITQKNLPTNLSCARNKEVHKTDPKRWIERLLIHTMTVNIPYLRMFQKKHTMSCKDCFQAAHNTLTS
jgi:hypothetical protein